MKKINRIIPTMPNMPARKRVCAYARVSSDCDKLAHSLSTQISYYSSFIQSNKEWEYAGVYADNAVSGTGLARRSEFQRMLADCETGAIDIILTKSISRFARNTVDLLNTVRHLKELGIEVRFEKENISSLSGDGELLLTLLASFAQEESRSTSENIKWRIEKRFEQGLHNGRFHMYGYRWEGDTLVVVPEEAEVVRLIFANYMNNISPKETAEQLEKMGVKGLKGGRFSVNSIRNILINITYTGNLLFQKKYTIDPISKKIKPNHGELPQYWVESSHEAIIPFELFEAVQAEKKRRRELGICISKRTKITCFTDKIKCPFCNKSYRCSSRSRENHDVWMCYTKISKIKPICCSKNIRDDTLKQECASVLGLDEFDEDVFTKQVKCILMKSDDEMVFHLYNGEIVHHKWKSTERSDCWTEERRAKASEYNRCFDNRSGNTYDFSRFLKCSKCGKNYRCKSKYLLRGKQVRDWRCRSYCIEDGIKDEELHSAVTELLGLTEFDVDIFREKMEYATVYENRTIVFHFRDGREVTRIFSNERRLTDGKSN